MREPGTADTKPLGVCPSDEIIPQSLQTGVFDESTWKLASVHTLVRRGRTGAKAILLGASMVNSCWRNSKLNLISSLQAALSADACWLMKKRIPFPSLPEQVEA